MSSLYKFYKKKKRKKKKRRKGRAPRKEKEEGKRKSTGAPNNGFLLNTLKNLFSLSRVLLDL